MKTFDNANLEILRADIMNALKEVEQKYGIQFKLGSIRYSAETFSATLESFITNNEAGLTPEKIEYNQYCEKFGLKKEWFDQEFKWKSSTYRIVGIKKYADRFPVLVVRLGENSNIYKIPASVIIKALTVK